MRRIFNCVLVCTLLIAGSTHAYAEPQAKEAKAALQQSMDTVFSLLHSEKFSDEKEYPALLDAIENSVKEIFDYREFAARTVGRKWRKFTPEQQQQFSNAFAELLRATYLERIKDYSGNGVTYVGERTSKKGHKVEIQTQLDLNGQQVPVHYRMLLKDKWMVYDVVVEGVSLVKNYRTQFMEILRKKNPEHLINRVQQRVTQIRTQHKTE